MKICVKGVALLGLVALMGSVQLRAQQRRWNTIYSADDITRDSVTQKGITLIFVNKQKGFSEMTKRQMQETFFKIYPKEIKKYNPKSLTRVAMIIDPAYKGVAATAGGVIRVSPEWMKNNPEDVDVVTHEAMHIVQAYPHGAGPGWITEGIADYVRFEMGVNNKAAQWALPDLAQGQSYTNAYRVTARFLYWITKHYKKDFVVKLDAVMRKGGYTADFWKAQTGKSVDELWASYQKQPAI